MPVTILKQAKLITECDGNQVNADGCRNNCIAGVCGDGIQRIDGENREACDDGNTNNGDGCSSECVLELCGNGQVDQGEDCDDNNQVDTDQCTNSCRAATCGDGVIRTDLAEGDEGYEFCDDGNQTNTDSCTTACVVAQCGDAILRTDLTEGDTGYESCDDKSTQMDAPTVALPQNAAMVFVESMFWPAERVMKRAMMGTKQRMMRVTVVVSLRAAVMERSVLTYSLVMRL